jgi:hypothetical protein
MLDFSTKSTLSNPKVGMGKLVSLSIMLGLCLAILASYSGQPDAESAETPSPADPSLIAEDRPATGLADSAADPLRLATFQDHARRMDLDAYYYLLDFARRQRPSASKPAPGSEPAYAQLLDEPGRYRGRPIHLRGRLHRLLEYPAQPNEFGIQRQFEGWIYTQASGSFPYCLILADPPVDIAPAASLFESVEVSGYFLGWWRYTSKEGERTSAPIVAVSLIRRIPAPRPLADPRATLPAWGTGLLLLLVATLGWGAWRWTRPTSSLPSPTPLASDWEFHEAKESEIENPPR